MVRQSEFRDRLGKMMHTDEQPASRALVDQSLTYPLTRAMPLDNMEWDWKHWNYDAHWIKGVRVVHDKSVFLAW